MRFYSRLKSPSFHMFHAGYKSIGSANGNEILTRIKPGTIRFRQIPPSDTGGRIHLKGDVVNGILDSEVAAEDLRRAGHAILDDDKQDITEHEICQFLKRSDRYGIDFVSIDDEEVQSLEDMWIEEFGGKAICTLCEREFTGVDKARFHCRKSISHKEKVKAKGEHMIPPSKASVEAVA